MTITLEDAAKATVLHLRGEFDLSNTPDVEDALEIAANSGHAVVVVDLSDMTFAGTTMMRALIAGRMAALSRGSRLLIVRPTPIVWHAFEVMGLADRFDTFETIESALAAQSSG